MFFLFCFFNILIVKQWRASTYSSEILCIFQFRLLGRLILWDELWINGLFQSWLQLNMPKPNPNTTKNTSYNIFWCKSLYSLSGKILHFFERHVLKKKKHNCWPLISHSFTADRTKEVLRKESRYFYLAGEMLICYQ